MAEIGYISLILALCIAAYSLAALVIGTKQGYTKLVSSGRNGVLVVGALMLLASAALLYALITHDFEVAYVASYTNSHMALVYVISAFWAGNAGSLLFWGATISIFSAVVVICNWNKKSDLVNYASAIILATNILFLLILVLVVSPFDRLPTPLQEGYGLNPLLENPGMIIHPPLLLLGYAGCVIPFAFAMAALITGRMGTQWIKDSRKWTIFAWLTLGVGNVIGMWWAYVELGWGGYWAWDPVENAGLMPWLLITAFLHATIMQRKRGMLKIWSVALIAATFIMCIFGTYLTRSNLLSSVHTFGDTGLTPYFLTFLGITIVGSVGLIIYRWNALQSENKLTNIFSREGMFLIVSILFTLATFIILLGTLFPKITDTIGDQQTWTTTQFSQFVGSIFMIIILIMGICAVIGWKKTSPDNLKDKLLIPLIGGVLLCLFLAIIGIREWYALLFFPLLAFVALATTLDWVHSVRVRKRLKGGNLFTAFFGLLAANRPRYGGMIVHFGIVLMAMGIIGSSFYNQESSSVPLRLEQSMSIGEYIITYDEMTQDQDASKMIVTASMSVYSDGKFVTELKPQRLLHFNYEQPVTEVAVKSTLTEDLYISLDGWSDGGNTFFFTAKINPLINWIWIGGIVLLIGGVVCFWPDVRNNKREEQ